MYDGTVNKMVEPAATVIAVVFSMATADQIRKNSVVEINSREMYINNKPRAHGLADPRMGTNDPFVKCHTDGLSYTETPGYFGHIELAVPVFFTQHIKYILDILKCVCFKCSKLLIDKSEHAHALQFPADMRWDYVKTHATKLKRCSTGGSRGGCGCKQFDSIKVDHVNNIFAVWENIKEETVVAENGAVSSVTVVVPVQTKLTAEIVLRIFRRISNDDIDFMGFHPLFSHPVAMICEALPVAPPAVRPSVKLDANQRSEDDLTQIYSMIIKTNNELREKIKNGAHPTTIDALTTYLQHYIGSIASNKEKGPGAIAQRTGRPGRPLQCIASRLNHKCGRVRGNLMGKRVNFSARSVITAAPDLAIGQLGVPLKIAMNLTKPEIVNLSNRDFLLSLVRNGPTTYPGAKTIIKKNNGTIISLQFRDKSTVELELGDVVNRHMLDGDYVLFNRQPSLHRMSMLGHEVKVMQGDTFRMNVADTKPYNADFDGDEMNMHVPQTVGAEVELRQLAAVHHQIISPTTGAPIVGIFQDSLLGAFRITRPEVRFSARDAMNLLMRFTKLDFDEFHRLLLASAVSQQEQQSLSSFQVISQIMPPLTLMYQTELHKNDPSEHHVLEIVAGEFRRGQMEKGVFGKGTNGILQRICKDFGNLACAHFIDDFQNIVTEYMKTSSYSVGISDLLANSQTQTKIAASIAAKKNEVRELLQRVHLGIFENNTANSNAVELESQISAILNEATNDAGRLGRETLDADNRFVNIVKCGSKGSPVNIAQMISCLGQTSIDGRRVPYGFDGRTLPHFQKFDDSPEARGFIDSSFIDGLNPTEVFFHAMGGRIGLIDTAVKTSSTGYIQRRLIKGLEDLMVCYDMTVRNNKGKVVQFEYGEDHIDTTQIENQRLPLIRYSTQDIYVHFDMNSLENIDKYIYAPETARRFQTQLPQLRKRCADYVERFVRYRDLIVDKVCRMKDQTSVRAPVAFAFIIDNLQGQLKLNRNAQVDITPLEAFDLIEENFARELRTLQYAQPTALFEVLYYFFLSPRELVIMRRFHRRALLLLLEEVNRVYKRSIVNPGEMVGVVAGQSLGEPTTQLTLNTFHSAGSSSKTAVTRGVPRIEEILRLAKTPKKQSLTIELPDDMDADSLDRAKECALRLEHTKLIDIVKRVQICFDAECNSHLAADQDWLKQYHAFSQMVKRCAAAADNAAAAAAAASDDYDDDNDDEDSRWILRLEMDADAMLDKCITMDDVAFALQSFSMDLRCAFTDFNSDNLVFRISVGSEAFGTKTKRRTSTAAAAVAAAAAATAGNTGKPPRIPKKHSSGAAVAPPLVATAASTAAALVIDQTDDISALNAFRDKLLNSVVLRGVAGISAVTPRKVQNTLKFVDGKYTRHDKWVLDTVGTNLLEVLAIDGIDATRTFSNDIREVHRVLGVEALCAVLAIELNDVMEFSGAFTDYHHISLLIARMCSTKNLVPIFRTGILHDDIGPIAKATFETHTEAFLNGARFAAVDNMRGVSANVMFGQHGYYGTNAFQLVLDTDYVLKLQPSARKHAEESTDAEKQLQLEQVDAQIAAVVSATNTHFVSAVCNPNAVGAGGAAYYYDEDDDAAAAGQMEIDAAAAAENHYDYYDAGF